MADFDRVFEIGPVFRAEQSFTPRHMCEFTGLDIEMAIKESYHEVLDLLGDLFAHIFEGLETKYAKELEAINQQFPYDKFLFKRPVVKLTFEEGVKLLTEAGVKQDLFEDLSTETEKKLGAIVREKYETDFYILHRYPVNARPFYTMPCKDDPRFTNSYDLFMRGEEIISGAQRIHEPELLTKRAQECGIKVETIKDYIEAFKYGAFPHGGAGVGLERVVMFYCALGNIRKSSLFPRDPKRITP
jgi:aspartyl-tRNA synthetase